MPTGPQPVLSSFPLQVLLYFNCWYFVVWWVAEFCIFIWKGSELPYPSGNWGAEFFLVWVMIPIEGTRLFFGMKGNLTERKFPVFLCLALTIATLIVYIFFHLWQTYVLRAEVILSAIAYVFQACEIFLGLAAAANFARMENFSS
eukprot:m.120373 g.120373  ORF g.120373 m.120373 type:complete len:145 (+) comp9270_c0_seq7:17-451(+)